MSRTHRHGFTLIELLVVVSIIVLLVAIMVPALGLARHESQRNQRQGNDHLAEHGPGAVQNRTRQLSE